MRETSAVPLPDVSYARSGDVAIAYQVVGAGAPDVVFMRGIAGDLLSTWDQPLLVRHVEGSPTAAACSCSTSAGTGLSDRVREVQSLETTMDDVRAVMDAVGSEQRRALDRRARARASACSSRRPIRSAVPVSSSSTRG